MNEVGFGLPRRALVSGAALLTKHQKVFNPSNHRQAKAVALYPRFPYLSSELGFLVTLQGHSPTTRSGGNLGDFTSKSSSEWQLPLLWPRESGINVKFMFSKKGGCSTPESGRSPCLFACLGFWWCQGSCPCCYKVNEGLQL